MCTYAVEDVSAAPDKTGVLSLCPRGRNVGALRSGGGSEEDRCCVLPLAPGPERLGLTEVAGGGDGELLVKGTSLPSRGDLF